MCNQLRAHTFCFYVWSTCTALEETWSHKRGPAKTCFVFNHCLFWFLSSSTFFIPTFDFHFSVFFLGGRWVGFAVVDLSFLPNSLGKTHRKNMNKTWKTNYKTKQQTWTNIENDSFLILGGLKPEVRWWPAWFMRSQEPATLDGICIGEMTRKD